MSDEHEKPEVVEDGPLAEAIRDAAVPWDTAEEFEINEAFITEEGRVTSADDFAKEVIRKSMRCFDTDRIESEDTRQLMSKSLVEGSTQSDREIGDADIQMDKVKVIEPPYPPELLSAFLEVDETHFRCVRTKVTDAVGRDYSFSPAVNPGGLQHDPSKLSDAEKAAMRKELEMIQAFVEDANDMIHFEGVLDRAGMDYEAIGWAGVEVVRSLDMKIRKLAHAPATRLRVLKGWRGFVEILGANKFVYYQPFGQKVVSKRIDPITKKNEPYDPRQDGPLEASNPKLKWNLIDRETGKPTTDMSRAANELIWLTKPHPNTIYYGMADVLPALGWLLANVHIRDYVLQFFEHNTVPRYAVVIEGARLSEPVKKTITEYFGSQVKGKAHKTLIIPVPARGTEVKVRFEKLDADAQESSFQETKKNNSQSIMTSHGVSPAIIGISEHSELGSGKGLSQAEIYKDRIVTPSQRLWARGINRMWRLGLGVTLVVLKFSPLDVRDRKSEQEMYVGYMERGTMTINEIRLKLDLEPVEGGDRPFIMTPQGPFFIDEMTEASSADKQALEDEIEAVKNDMAAKAMADKVKADAERKAAAENGPPQNGNGKQPNSGPPKPQPAAS